MILYVLRHAIALDRTEWKGAEADRPLTKEGMRKMKEVAEGMKALKLSFDWILTSPYRRAFDTAKITAKALKAEDKLKISKSLRPDGDPKTLMRHVALDYRSWESILLVGHEPFLSRLVSVLLIGSPDAPLELKKGGLCKLNAAALTYGRCATLEWWLTPKISRKLA
jgi:phosphohistidine phosphatase